MRRVLMSAAPIVLAIGMTGGPVPATAPEPTPTPEPSACSDVCPMIYQPVTCEYSDGETRTFSNNCVAENYACEHGLEIVGCVARRGSAVG